MELDTLPEEDGKSRTASLSSAPSASSSPAYSHQPVHTPSTSSNEAGTNSQTDAGTKKLKPSFTPSERDNLRLMRYYQVAAAADVSSSPTQTHLWTELVPELSFDHPFLLHSILGISALHRALTSKKLPEEQEDPDSVTSLAALAQHHHVLALNAFREQLAELAPEMITTLFVTAALISLHTFANPLLDEKLDPSLKLDSVAEMATILYTLRGTGVIVRAGPEKLSTGPFSTLLLPELKDHSASLSVPIETALDRLKMRCYSSFAGIAEDEQKDYLFAIQLLRKTYMLWLEVPGVQMTGVPFAVLVPVTVLSAMREKQPLSLCILAMYGVVLHWLNRSVWLGPWGRRTVEAVAEEVGEAWKPEVEWALKEVGKAERSAVGLEGASPPTNLYTICDPNVRFRDNQPASPPASSVAAGSESKWQWD